MLEQGQWRKYIVSTQCMCHCSQLTMSLCLFSYLVTACPSASTGQGCDSDSVVGGRRQSWYSAPDALVGLGRGLWTRWRWAAACTTGESNHPLSAGVTETGLVTSCPTQGYLELKISILEAVYTCYVCSGHKFFIFWIACRHCGPSYWRRTHVSWHTVRNLVFM